MFEVDVSLQLNRGVFARYDDHLHPRSMIHMRPIKAASTITRGLIRRRQGIDPLHIQPARGQLYQLSGPGRAGKSMRCVAEHWVAHALVQGEVVHWVDGACRIDPSRFIPLLEALGGDVEACLGRLYLSRGFTLHQLDRQIERLPHELAITRSPMVVLDGLMAMHGDDAVSRLESRTLLKRHVRILRQLAEQHHAAVIAITGTEHSSHTDSRLLHHLHRHAQNHLEGAWRGRRRQRTLHLKHRKSGARGPWMPLQIDPQMRFHLTRRRLNREVVPPNVGALVLRHRDE